MGCVVLVLVDGQDLTPMQQSLIMHLTSPHLQRHNAYAYALSDDLGHNRMAMADNSLKAAYFINTGPTHVALRS